ncbi:hypothetical protein CDD81_1455 [Ophiocordyceps australis]|uniref:Malonyl-CoA:ACP transacylase (MAT) domain-containing protein n=1 Tax=Ophiocordyceps australis TaxID=1399860 RepID=A0A2C5XKI1_9HYPO|nr:hypothetical protein CDD81_1455 [Ophiocordyceps australis]
MPWRTFTLAHTTPSMAYAKPVRSASQLGLAFIFTGQGAHYVNMGIGLLAYPVFARTLRHIDKTLAGLGCTWSIFDQLGSKTSLARPEYQHAISCAVQIALVELLRSFNVVASAVLGHSSGEVAAAYTIGALSLESACKVSYFRGQVSGRAVDAGSDGAMLSANIAHDQVKAYVHRHLPAHLATAVSVACINSPLNSTLAGRNEAIDALKEKLDLDGVFAHKLDVGLGYHSKQMHGLAPEYRALLGTLQGADSPQKGVPMISSVTGGVIDPARLATAEYWVDHLISPVRFSQAVTNLVQLDARHGSLAMTDLVEIGPHAALKRPLRDILDHGKHQIRYTPTLFRSKPALEAMLECAGTLHCYGYPVSVTAVNQQDASQEGMHVLVDCPEYPFDHSKKYWRESRLSCDYRLRATTDEMLGIPAHDWNPLEPRWRQFLSVEKMPWLAGHLVRFLAANIA